MDAFYFWYVTKRVHFKRALKNCASSHRSNHWKFVEVRHLVRKINELLLQWSWKLASWERKKLDFSFSNFSITGWKKKLRMTWEKQRRMHKGFIFQSVCNNRPQCLVNNTIYIEHIMHKIAKIRCNNGSKQATTKKINSLALFEFIKEIFQEFNIRMHKQTNKIRYFQ